MAKIDITRSWHVGKGIIHAGIYRVPQDMDPDRAAEAVKTGYGVMLPEEKPKQTFKPFQGSRKTPAPENKIVGSAPEDKETKPFRDQDD